MNWSDLTLNVKKPTSKASFQHGAGPDTSLSSPFVFFVTVAFDIQRLIFVSVFSILKKKKKKKMN